MSTELVCSLLQEAAENAMQFHSFKDATWRQPTCCEECRVLVNNAVVPKCSLCEKSLEKGRSEEADGPKAVSQRDIVGSDDVEHRK
eukprot:11673848-Karenia_brevis.AAC.1